MAKYIWLGIFFLGQLQLSVAQPKNTIKERDSLLALLPKLTTDTQRIDVLSLISESYMSIDPALSMKYMDEAHGLAKKINNKPRIFGTMISLGYRYCAYGESTKSIQILQEAIKLATQKSGVAIANTFIGRAFLSQNDFENALKYILLGYNYYNEEWKNGTPTVDGYPGANMCMGEVYLSMGRLDSAYYYLQEAYNAIKKGNKNRFFSFHIPLLLGQVHLQRNEGTIAFKYLQEGLQEAQNLSDNVGICEAELGLSQYYNNINRSDSMVVYALSAVEIAQKIRTHKTVLDASVLLKSWYQKQNNFHKALYYNDLAIAAQDSLSSADKIKQSQRLIFQEEQYQQSLEAEKTAYRNRLMLYGLIAGLCLLGLLAWVLYLNYKRKQKENLLLSNEMKFQETAFQSKLVETEMTALRAQMNPHFIFNCLNSIKLHTLENKPIVASDYLTKFSKLIRLVLENSRSEKVTLVNELDMLQLYMEMEAMRFKDKMQFKINIEEDLDTHFIEIPPLLLQPYIENAIWHGLMHKEEGGSVILDIETKDEQMLRITITDDGIGRKAAAALKSKTATNNKSFGLKMTSERIGLINQLYKSDTQVQIEDLTDAAGNALGTRVIIEIPI